MPPPDQEKSIERLAAEVERLRHELLQVRAELDAERANGREKSTKLDELLVLQAMTRNEAAEKIAKLEAEIRQLKKHFLGPKSEKIPTLDAELKKADNERADPAEIRKKREENARAREPKRRREIFHHVPDASRICPRCAIPLLPKGGGWLLDDPLIEYVGEAFELEEHFLEMLFCPECEYEVTASGPTRVLEGGRYGPGFFAFLIVSKCGDSIPIYRLEKRFKRLGIPMARSTMNNLAHGAARELEPIYKRMLELIKGSDLTLADETSMRVQKRKKRGFVWAFTAPIFGDDSKISGWIKGYKFSPDRSGDTPKAVLGDSKGFLVVDMYTGYNTVTKVEGRERAGCNGHSRRYFYDSLETAPDAARKALDFYLEVFRVEREAKKLGIETTPAHLELRQAKSRPIMDRFKTWLEEEQPRHLPKGPMGQAISYALHHWDALTLFLTDARIPMTNNISEGNLRVVALGRKNFLHFGNDEAGQNFAILYSIVSSCEANGVNPIEYLKDVLIRVHTHPSSRIDELLPHHWHPRIDEDDGDPNGGDPAPDPPADHGSGASGEDNIASREAQDALPSRGDTDSCRAREGEARAQSSQTVHLDEHNDLAGEAQPAFPTIERQQPQEETSSDQRKIDAAVVEHDCEDASARGVEGDRRSDQQECEEGREGTATAPSALCVGNDSRVEVDAVADTATSCSLAEDCGPSWTGDALQADDRSACAEERRCVVNPSCTSPSRTHPLPIVALLVLLGAVLQLNLRNDAPQVILRVISASVSFDPPDLSRASFLQGTMHARDGPHRAAPFRALGEPSDLRCRREGSRPASDRQAWAGPATLTPPGACPAPELVGFPLEATRRSAYPPLHRRHLIPTNPHANQTPVRRASCTCAVASI